MVISRGQTCVWAPTNRLISCRVMRKVSSISFKRIPVGMDCRVLFLYHKIVHEAQNVHMLRLDWSVIISECTHHKKIKDFKIQSREYNYLIIYDMYNLI